MAERKQIVDDVVEYRLFFDSTKAKISDDSITQLEERLDAILAFVSPFVVEHIWQLESFSLSIVKNSEDYPFSHLFGRTCYGDNIDDEWFIVFLLLRVSQAFPDAVISVRDSDGEFLLIEAADYLPKWLDPETAENRVFLYRGKLHIIPQPQSPGEITTLPSGIPSLEDALRCIRENQTITQASPDIQDALRERINEFPLKNIENTHYAHCYLPANLASILETRPSIVSHGVRSFYYRDPIDLRCCRTMKYFRPGTRVLSRVKMTRCLYAQLMQQDFQADRRSGWTMPSTSNPKYNSHALGMKLAHGFEILCSKASSDSSSFSQNNSDYFGGRRWRRYLESLKTRGYFKGEMEGSALYQELLEKAREFFQEQISPSDEAENMGDKVLQMLETTPYDIEDMRKAEMHLKPPDDDSWLNITPEVLDNMMKKRGGGKLMDDKSRKEDDMYDLSQLANSMNKFIKKPSDVKGARFPGEENESEDDEDEIQFDSTGFMSELQDMLTFDEDKDSSDSSDMDEYGWEGSDSEGETGSSKVKAKKKALNLNLPRKHNLHAPSNSNQTGSQPSDKPKTVKDYMDIMDRELSSTNVGKSFEKENTSQPNPKKLDIDDEDDDFKPVNIDLNLVKNMLESVAAQQGLAGPVSNMLGSMGIKLPPPDEEDKTPAGGTPIQVNKDTMQADASGPKPPPRGKKLTKSPPPRPPPPKTPRPPPPKTPTQSSGSRPTFVRSNSKVQSDV